MADPPAAVRAHAQGPDLRSDRSDDRRRHDLAARDARRRAQLGLPLQLAARLDLHAVGPLDPRLRPRGERLLLLHRRPGRGRGPADHVRDRRARAARRGDARSPLRATKAPARSGSATTPGTSASTMCWGVLLDSVRLHTRSGDRLDDRLWTLLARQVDAALEHWREPDRGIWEVRGEPKHFTSSKLFCWVAADRGARLARLRGDADAAERWGAAAEEMHEDICEHGTDDRGVFVQHYDTDALDASLLLLPLVGFLPSDRRAGARDGAGDRRRADGRRPGPPLPRGRRPTTGSRARRGRSRSARSGSSPRSRRSAR